MKLVTYNVNGIRAALRKGLLDWVRANDFDIICIQETKSQPEQVDLSEFNDLGYSGHWHSAVKKGYSGVLTLSKSNPEKIVRGMGVPEYDNEGRVLRTDFPEFCLLNCYFPSGSSGEPRHQFKMNFLKDFKPFVNQLLEENSRVVVVGDYNIVHGDMDIHNPQRRDNPSGFRPGERKWLDSFFDDFFVDAFRDTNPLKQEFSWWSYRAGSRARNKGWRIDYIAVSKDSGIKILKSGHDQQAKQSDHCPVWAHLNI